MKTVTNKYEIQVKANPSIQNFLNVLEILLFVPDERVKPKIIEGIVNHYSAKLNTPEYRVAIFIAYQQEIPLGMVTVQIDPEYRTYNRKGTTFS